MPMNSQHANGGGRCVMNLDYAKRRELWRDHSPPFSSATWSVKSRCRVMRSEVDTCSKESHRSALSLLDFSLTAEFLMGT